MRDFNGRRTFTASILVDPIQAEFKNDGFWKKWTPEYPKKIENQSKLASCAR